MKRKKNKLLLLVTTFLLVFLYPLFVNSFHTLEGHIPHNQCCQNNTSQIIIDHPEEFCFIHEYEFSVNDIPESGSKEFSDNYFTEIPVREVSEIALEIFNNQTSPRAPPYFSYSFRG